MVQAGQSSGSGSFFARDIGTECVHTTGGAVDARVATGNILRIVESRKGRPGREIVGK